MPQRIPAIFIADSVGLDFLNSVAVPVDTQVDWLVDGEGFLAWIEQAGLVPSQIINAMREKATPGEIDRVAEQARTLREWFRTFVRGRKGKPLKFADLNELEPLNRLLERDESYSQLVAERQGRGAKFEVRRVRRWRTPESLLIPIAEALAQFLSEENFSDVKSCEGATCTLLFADHTRGRSRRWCSMEICGNRAKQSAHRHRRKGTPQK
jgi:predicted RNA-binding Zn ribbon-like protein